MQPKDRLIFHCDCNNFFASCECLEHPEWKDVPLAVAGDPEHRTGVVFAKNEMAKRYGVKTTDTVWQARQKCPGIQFTPPRHGYYAEISAKVNAIYREYTDFVEPASIDESFLDMTGVPEYFHISPVQMADRLRARVREEIGITISIGVSYNKVFAKLGSDYRKPDATTEITRENYQLLLWPLPVEDMLFVGKAAARILHSKGIETIGHLASSDPGMLEKWLGKGGESLWRHANGLDYEPVHRFDEKTEVKSVSRGSTFRRNLITESDILSGLSPLADEVAATLRKHHLKGSVVQLQIKAPDLHTLSRQTTLPRPTFLYREIMDTAMRLIHDHWQSGLPIRAMTIGVTSLESEQQQEEQLSLFDADPAGSKNRKNQEKLEKAIDAIRSKHGNSAISFGFLQQDEL